jgi:hypothetical protein
MSSVLDARLATLVGALTAAWHAPGGEPGFPARAVRALGDAEAHLWLSPLAITRHALFAPGSRFERQRPARQALGEPAVTLHVGARFALDAVFLHPGALPVPHPVRGALHVLTGRLCFTRRRFRVRERLGPSFALGDVDLVHEEIVAPGDTRALGEHAEVHDALVPPDEPAVTLVVRRRGQAATRATLRPPHLLVDEQDREERLTRALQLYTMLATCDPVAASAHARALLAGSDLHAAYLVLEAVLESTPDDDEGLARLVEQAVAHHGERARLFAPVLAARRADLERVRARRAATSTPRSLDPETP